MLQTYDNAPFPLPLTEYPTPSADGLLHVLVARIEADPFNTIATAIFLLAVVHTFFAARFTDAAHRLQHRRNAAAAAAGLPPTPSVAAELLHFLGEVEVIFGLWGVPLVISIVVSRGWTTATHYLNDTVNYTEPMFVVVIMALASTRPIVELAEGALRRVASIGGCSPAAWWMTILTVGPLLGSFITEPAAMTIAALLLARQFYDLQPGRTLRYATLGLLFVNVSIGGTLTHFAAPPVLMVARPWAWDTTFMLGHFGWRAALAIVASTLVYYLSVSAGASSPGAASGGARCRGHGAGGGRLRSRIAADSMVGNCGLCAIHRVDGRQRPLPGAVRGWLPVLPRIRSCDSGVLDAV